MPPALAATASAWSSTAASSRASTAAVSADPPAERISSATWSRRSRVRPARWTVAPSRAKLRGDCSADRPASSIDDRVLALEQHVPTSNRRVVFVTRPAEVAGLIGGGPPGRGEPHRLVAWQPLAMGSNRFDQERLVEEATTLTGEDDFGEPTWQEGLDVLLDSLQHEARLHELGVEIAAGDVTTYLANRLGINAWRRDHPAVAAGTDREAGHHRRPTAYRHHDPLRPAGPRPGAACPAGLGGRSARSASGDRHVRHRPPHR